MQERDKGERRLIYYKSLRLIAPEFANGLGIYSEAPVFISPMVLPNVCKGCGVRYKPLIYEAGGTVRAHHSHEDGVDYEGGGIYYHLISSSSEGFEIFPLSKQGWLALLVPIATPLYSGRAPEVRIAQIRAYCIPQSCQGSLKEGIVAGHPGFLLPACSVEKHPNLSGSIQFNFKISEGQVLFSQI